MRRSLTRSLVWLIAASLSLTACGGHSAPPPDISCLILTGTWIKSGNDVRAQDGRRIGSVAAVEPTKRGVVARLAVDPDVFVPPHTHVYVERVSPGNDVLVVHVPRSPATAQRATQLVTRELRGAGDPGWWLELPR